jgi:hypothetical protein
VDALDLDMSLWKVQLTHRQMPRRPEQKVHQRMEKRHVQSHNWLHIGQQRVRHTLRYVHHSNCSARRYITHQVFLDRILRQPFQHRYDTTNGADKAESFDFMGDILECCFEERGPTNRYGKKKSPKYCYLRQIRHKNVVSMIIGLTWADDNIHNIQYATKR